MQSSTRSVAIPVIRVRDVLLVSIQVQLTDRLIDQLKADIARAVQATLTRGLIVEVSGVDVFDSYIARSVRDLAQIARLMGVTTVLVGLDPGIAMTLVEMDMLMSGVHTELDVGGALDLLNRVTRTRTQNDDELLAGLLGEGVGGNQSSGAQAGGNQSFDPEV